MDVKSLFSLEGKKGFITGREKGGVGTFKWEIQGYRL